MRATSLLAAALTAALAADGARAFDKNGVAPQAISLPSGPGSIQGLGESFQPQLNSGSGSTGVKLALPHGPGGITPELSFDYNSGGGNGPLGVGWSLSGMLSIRCNTDRGVPLYVDGPDGADNDADGRIDNPGEMDIYTGMSGEELVPLADGSFRAENESAFYRYERVGGGWEARGRDGRLYLFGVGAAARIEDAGRVFEWCLERLVDSNGNAIDYEYQTDPLAPAQKYLRRVRWGASRAYLAAVLGYEEGRPDVFTSYRSCFEVRTRLRLSRIDVISHGIPAPAAALRGELDGAAEGAGVPDALIRRYRLEYQAGAHLSLLSRVTQLGHDAAMALPTLSYEYTSWTPPDDVAAAVIRSRNAPPEGFDSPSVELIDMNGDALPDLLSTSGSQHRVFLNLGLDPGGRLAWAPGRPVENAPTIDISSDRTHLADATADGLSDLMVKVSNTSFLCFDNTSENAWVSAPFPIRNTDTWPIWPHDGDGGQLSRSFDSDYSRSNDVLHTGPSGLQLWLFLADGRYALEQRLPPLTCDGEVFRFDQPGTHIADLNGDRLQDLAWIQATRAVYFPSRGRGDFAPPLILPLGRTLSAAEIERADFSDVDGDGLVDLTVVRPAALPNGVLYWLNRFERGLDGPRTVLGLPAQRSGDALRWADLNGNGTTDIAISQAQAAAGEKILVVDLVPEGKPFLLRQADNGLGRRIQMDYEPSTAQMVRAAASSEPWATRMPVVVTVVGRIREEDGLSPPHEQILSYRDPYYDPVKQEFRGFRGAEAREAGDASVAAKVSRFVFDTGRVEPCRKGKPLSEEVLGEDGTLFERSVTTWRTRVFAEGVDGRRVCFAFSEAVDRFVHEGEPTGVQIRTETDHDDFGNVTAERRLGVAGEPGDEVMTERVYEIRLADWRLDLLSRELTRDGSGKLMAERRSSYDARGNLEREEVWLDTEDRMVAVLRQDFDEFGNVIERTDARASRRSFGYDAFLHAMPVTEVVHLAGNELTMTAEYDLGSGVVTGAVDFSGQRSDFVLDPLGRLIELRQPGGAGETYEYHLGSPTSRVIKRVREDAQGGTYDSYSYSDGHGRPLGSKVEGEDGRWRFLEAKAYNARKLAARSWLPHESDSPEYALPDASLPHETMTYDALGRPLETQKADGSRTRTEYRPLAVAVHDGNDLAGAGSPDLRRLDGLGRMAAVEERNGAEAHVTTYGWNARGELESITDALANVKSFRFDSLGRSIEVNDPDRGLRRYTYDDAGNLLTCTDAKGRVTTYVHDAADRILEKDHVGRLEDGADPVDSVYHYDAPFGSLDFGDGTSGSARNVLGRLAWVEDRSGEEHYSYDQRGNLEWVLKRLRDPSTDLLTPYRTQRGHDLMDREAEVIFPDNDRLLFHHGAGSFVGRIDGGPQGGVVLSEAEYAASGQPLRLRLGNGCESSFEYDASQRLEHLKTLDAAGVEIIHQTLVYDQAFNITRIDDARPVAQVPEPSLRRATARFLYDELHRLTRASYGTGGSGGQIDYAYDALGNLLRQTTPDAGMPGHLEDPAVSLGAVSYAGGRDHRQGRGPSDSPGPHAVTATGNGHRLAYDADGNVTALDDAVLAWDYEDLIEGYRKPGIQALYVHDHAERRVAKRVERGRARSETLYVDRAFEVVDGSPAKYAILDGKRLARIQGMLDPGRERVQRLRLAGGWNLVAAAVETTARLRDVFGADAAVYEAHAGSYAPLDTAARMPAALALWVHVPTARLAVVRGPPAKTAGTPSPGPLHAWPRLGPFRPQAHLEGDPALHVYDAVRRSWLRRDPSLPAFLSEAPQELGAAQAFWSAEAVSYAPGSSDPQAIVHYHQDGVGSTAALTDAEGRLIEERTHYPFGGVRHVHRPGASSGGTDYDFTGKERDGESGLTSMGARSYFDLVGSFLSPDPRFTEAARLAAGSKSDQASFTAFLANPQMGNLYAHGLRNPLKYVDPDGLEVIISKELQNDPTFKKAWKALVGTQEGRKLFNSLDEKGYRITVGKGDLTKTPNVEKGTFVGGLTTWKPGDKNIKITLDLDAFAKNVSKELQTKELARITHHEFIHASLYRAMNNYLGLARAASNQEESDAHMSLFRYVDSLHERLEQGQHPSEIQFKKEVGLTPVTLEIGEVTVTPIRPK